MELRLPIIDAYRQAFHPAILQQILVSLICLLALDGGRLARICGVALLAYWSVVFILMLRRPNSPTAFDLLWVRWSFVPQLLVAMFIAGLFGR